MTGLSEGGRLSKKPRCPHCNKEDDELNKYDARFGENERYCPSCLNMFTCYASVEYRTYKKNENGTITFSVGKDWPEKDPENLDYYQDGGAITLMETDIGKHDSGWTIKGEIHDDYFTWVNDFEAEHTLYGKLEGNYEQIIHAESVEAFSHFYKNHPPVWWDLESRGVS